MLLRKITLTLIWPCIIFAPASALAEAGWSEPSRVLELIPTSRHYYEFRLALDDNPGGCRKPSWFFQNYDASGADEMFTLLIESLKSNLSVRVYVTGICNLHGYAEISAVSVAAEDN